MATSTTVRLNKKSYTLLRELAEKSGESMQQVLAKVLEQYRRQKFLEQVSAEYAALRADPVAWKEIEEEQKEWDVTLLDGLEDDEYPLPPAQ